MSATPDAVEVLPTERRLDVAEVLRLQRMGRYDPTWRHAPGAVAHATRTPEGAVTVRFVQGDGEVVASLWGPGTAWMRPRLGAWIGCEDDPYGFVQDCPRDSVKVRELLKKHGSVHLSRAPLLVPVLLACVLQQRVTYVEAARSWRMMCTALGRPAPGPIRLQTTPDLARLAAWGTADLHPLGVEASRATVLRMVAERSARIEQLYGQTPQDVVQTLQKLPRLGPWTLNMLAATALGDADAVPTGDYHLPHTVAWALKGIERSNDAEMLRLLAPYRPHRARLLRLFVVGGVSAPKRGPKHKIRRIHGA